MPARGPWRLISDTTRLVSRECHSDIIGTVRTILVPLILCGGLFAADPALTPEKQTVLNHISAQSMRGNLSFLSSDVLEGRNTPSRGLDLAAEYIASEFRRAGLEPIGNDGYFQNARVMVREPNREGFRMSVTTRRKTIQVAPEETSILPDAAVDLENAPLVVVDADSTLRASLVDGKVVYATSPRAVRALRNWKPLLVLTSAREVPTGSRVSDPETERRGSGSGGVVANAELREILKPDETARITLHVQPPIERQAAARNVAGVLRGSDPLLRDTYVMLTAHYDHVGMRASGEDRIYNGANDDGSGTVSVIEIAQALAEMGTKPKRSIVFVTFFGEEKGLLGSRYYARHPLVPLDRTIADMNLEQLGRTDASNGPQVATLSPTGFEFSDVTRILERAGRLTGVKIYKDGEDSNSFFARSDNQALADAGIPAHTLCVAFDYPDYHGVGDEWQKIDYANMAKVDRTVALALLQMASDAPPPKWNASNSATRRYVEAAKKLHAGE